MRMVYNRGENMKLWVTNVANLFPPSKEKNLILAFGMHIGPCDRYALIMINKFPLSDTS